MQWLNYHHLYYFWVVNKEGSISSASKLLRIAQPTISAQIKSLENMLAVSLFERKGRKLELTEMGKVVLGYAEEIFSLGKELLEVVEGKSQGKIKALKIGVVDSMPKNIVAKLIAPSLASKEKTNVICYEDHADKLFLELATKELDAVISDFPLPSSVKIKAFNHHLGRSGISFIGSERFTKSKIKFPRILENEPLLLPTIESSVRRELNNWFQKRNITPNIIAEFQDSALMKMLGSKGIGIFPIPSVIEKEIIKDFNLKVIGRISEQLESFYLITVEKRIKHHSLLTIIENAERKIF